MSGLDSKAAPGLANSMGTGIFATTNIMTGDDVLIIQSPFTAVLDTPRLEDTCSGCFGKRHLGQECRNKLRSCAGCGVVRYCDKVCQAKDWKIAHSLECRIFTGLRPRILPNNVRAVLRIVLRSEHHKYEADELSLLLRLETHIQEIRGSSPAQWERIVLSSKAVKAYAKTGLEEEEISSLFAKLDLNSFNFTNALYDRIGLYMHPYAALINHSCDFNSVVGFDGGALYVKAIRPIKKGEQIFISYVDTTNPSTVRRSELSDRYYFDCRCSKCAPDSDAISDSALISPENLPEMGGAVEQQARDMIESASICRPTQAIENLKSAMMLLDAHPITCQPHVSLRDDLIITLLSASRFNAAFIQASIRYLHVDPVVFQYKSHPIRQIHAWALAKIAIHLSQGAELNPSDTDIQCFQFDFGIVIWSILSDLVSGEARSGTVPSFRRLVRSAFDEVHGQFTANGIDLGSMGGQVKEEWAKVEKMIRGGLEGGQIDTT